MGAATAAGQGLERRRLRVAGVVQGVGFRPHVHRLAAELGLGGFVANDTAGVLVEAEGGPSALDSFAARLVGEAPPMAVVERVMTSRLEPRGERAFRVVESLRGPGVQTLVPPDVATCQECLAELFDASDRRYRYPFVNCTNCGPRFTIITALPYDRARTTMSSFPLCARCAEEYGDPADRRFHAEPVACPQCGPSLCFEHGPGGSAPVRHASVGTDPALEQAQLALEAGRVVAVKGIGGYHLACDATSDEAVGALRSRKGRGDKPFAVMIADLDAAQRLARLSEAERAVLASPQRPIVLVELRRRTELSDLVAPGNPRIGLLLAYSPLHHLLFSEVPGSKVAAPQLLVMTSGNAADEPIAYDDGDARRRLAQLADDFLLHDRAIHVPCDDSVVLLDGEAVLPLRRSRGYAPLPLRLPVSVPAVVAFGAELKSTACLATGTRAWMSQHIGDMGSAETLGAFSHSVARLEKLYEVSPEVVAADLHPAYHSRHLAEERCERQCLRLELVQHHHAHVAAVMAEHRLPVGSQVVGFAFDGTGYGEDGAIWGGEVLVAGYERAERAAHLAYAPLPGGDSAVRKPYRVALAFLHGAGIDWSEDLEPVRAAAPGELAALRAMLEQGVATVATSSTGRLFDAVASLTGLRQVTTYEAQAAIELEGAARASLAEGAEGVPGPYRFSLEEDRIETAPLLRALVEDVRAGCSPTGTALAFHQAVAGMIGEVAATICERSGIGVVALAGGVFQNVLLLDLARAELVERGLEVLTSRLVPPSDGGLALGQAVVAGIRDARR